MQIESTQFTTNMVNGFLNRENGVKIIGTINILFALIVTHDLYISLKDRAISTNEYEEKVPSYFGTVDKIAIIFAKLGICLNWIAGPGVFFTTSRPKDTVFQCAVYVATNRVNLLANFLSVWFKAPLLITSIVKVIESYQAKENGPSEKRFLTDTKLRAMHFFDLLLSFSPVHKNHELVRLLLK